MDACIDFPKGHPRPHDLLWLDDPSALIPVDTWPAWATRAWVAVAPVVVRRAPTPPDGRLPVGLRGATRSERCAALALGSRVIRQLAPEDIAQLVSKRADLIKSPRPCLRTLARLGPCLDDLTSRWGVTGSVGFTLASGFDVLRADSDLDLLVRAADPGDAVALRTLASITQAADSRVDVQVETRCGAFALGEWIRTGGPVLLKTLSGPLMCEDPWDAEVLGAKLSVAA